MNGVKSGVRRRMTAQVEREQPSEEEAQRQAPKTEPDAGDLPKEEPGSGPQPERTDR